MAFTEFYVQTTASNMNGGSSNTDAADYTSTNGNWSTSTNIFIPISGNPSSSGVAVGKFASIYIDGATAPVYGARVTAVTSTNFTLSTTAKWGTAPITSTTARTAKVGGAWKGPNAAVSFPFNLFAATATDATGNQPRVNFKGGTNYAITAAMTHSIAGPVVFQGYTTTVDDGGKATIDGGTTAMILLTASGAGNTFTDLIFSNNGTTGTNDGVFSSGAKNLFRRCVFHDLRGNGLEFATAGPSDAVECEAYNCNQSATGGLAGFQNSVGAGFYRCYSHNNTGGNTDGFRINIGTNTVPVVACIADGNTGNGFDIIATTGSALVVNCVGYGNTWHGLTTAANVSIVVSNSIFMSNSLWGVDVTTSTGSVHVYLENNAYYNNTSGTSNLLVGSGVENGKITLSASPFVAASTGDFRLATSATTVRGDGVGTFTQTGSSKTGTVGYPDCGAVQHLETASGGGGAYTFA